ncbi:MAG: hypothetical protein ACXV5Q_14150, partial [Frankiaceae bacterium]
GSGSLGARVLPVQQSGRLDRKVKRMTNEANSQAPPKRSRTLRRAGVIAALAVGLVAGGFGIASAASPSPSPTQTAAPNQSTPNQPNGACQHGGGQPGTGSSGTTTDNPTGGSYQL